MTFLEAVAVLGVAWALVAMFLARKSVKEEEVKTDGEAGYGTF